MAGMPQSGFQENQHTVGVAGPGVRRFCLAQGGNYEGPLIRRRRTFTASGTTVGGMDPGPATEPGSSSKNNGVGTAPQYRHTLGRVDRPAQAPQAGQTSRPGKTRRLGPNNWRKTAEPGTAKASSPASATHGVLRNPAAGQLPSHPGRMMGTRLQSTTTEATVPRPCLWSAGTWQQCPSRTR